MDAAFRAEWGRVVATLIGRTGDWDLAEECTQEAFAEALRSWTAHGIPQRPGAWLTTVAANRAIDRLRRGARGAELLEQVAREASQPKPVEELTPELPSEAGDIADDRLRLMFTCCHPALPLEGQVALTLRSLAGLTTAEIARAFLVPEATMAKRLTRTKAKIAAAGIPYRVPPTHLLAERTAGVLALSTLSGQSHRRRATAPVPLVHRVAGTDRLSAVCYGPTSTSASRRRRRATTASRLSAVHSRASVVSRVAARSWASTYPTPSP